MGEEKNIYKMKLHESFSLNLYLEVLRVAGGWIYTSHSSDAEETDRPTSVFVQFDNSFMTKDKNESSS